MWPFTKKQYIYDIVKICSDYDFNHDILIASIGDKSHDPTKKDIDAIQDILVKIKSGKHSLVTLPYYVQFTIIKRK